MSGSPTSVLDSAVGETRTRDLSITSPTFYPVLLGRSGRTDRVAGEGLVGGGGSADPQIFAAEVRNCIWRL